MAITVNQRNAALFDIMGLLFNNDDSALADDLADVRGTAVAAPAATRDIIEDRMVALYEDWQRWKTTRVEAQARSLAAAVITALTNREDAAWAKYVQSIQVWRNA